MVDFSFPRVALLLLVTSSNDCVTIMFTQLIVLLLLWLFVSDFRLIIFLEDISFCFSYRRIQVKIKVMYVYTHVCMYSSNPRHHTTAVKRVRRFLVLFAEIPFTG